VAESPTGTPDGVVVSLPTGGVLIPPGVPELDGDPTMDSPPIEGLDLVI
jgi:hypothetical protein